MANIIEFKQTGGPEQLQIIERPITPPAPDEVQVAIKAAGLNRAELLFLAGQYLVQPSLPSRIGLEASGVIKAVGENVDQFSVGQAASITPNLDPTQYGVLGEVVNVPVAALQLKPESASFINAAAFWMAYPTAWGGLVQTGGLTANVGQNVLISAASSSVGIAAIQIAKAYGANVIATTRTAAKVDAIRSVGPDHIVVTDEEDLVERVQAITNSEGFDIAFDPVGGPFVEALATAAGREAIIVEYGLLSGEQAPLPFFTMVGKGLSIKAFHLVFDLLQHPDRLKIAIEHLLPRLEDGTYAPVIDQIYPLEKFQEAYQRLASNQQFGKVVIEVTA
ncbi:Quinone oxidoreductase 1 [Acaryochloris thomasi RCC1774]|uniref:Quinone oxidoreductase 1 n=1 Tax=Acaryochloris thomasi RCC1774 TaxID=1764569 RepID=A0A2W1JP96_9CYAN|nr:zinc-dependent alcohol dehydrogenase family protein [Acaryochloris thomasi]PZD75160.1 Quinone oxidoreductase 1 [Acaryochloris thomasi RCC1774]